MFANNEAGARKGPRGLERHLLVRSLRPTETISSWLDRNASLWGTRRDEFISKRDVRLLGPKFDIDAFKDERQRREWLAEFGLKTTYLDTNRITRPELCVASDGRFSYCPLCMYSDLRSGVFPYFRSDWARFFLTHCPQHQCPLYRWDRVKYKGTRYFPHEWHLDQFELTEKTPVWFRRDLNEAMQFAKGCPPISSESAVLWHALIAFETRLLSEGVGGPGARGEVCRNSALERQAMGICVLLLNYEGTDAASMPASALRPAFAEHCLISFTLRRYRMRRSINTWNGVRKGLTNLPCRRAVLVLAAQTLDLLGATLRLADGSTYERGGGLWEDRLISQVGDPQKWIRARSGHLNAVGSLRPWVPC